MRRCLIYERNPKEGATMKKISVIIAIMLTAVLLCTAFVGCTNKDKDADKTYVSMDINPSVNLVIDGEGKVESVEAANEDAILKMDLRSTIFRVKEKWQQIINECWPK